MRVAITRSKSVLPDVVGAVALVLCIDGALFLFVDETGSRGGPLLGSIPGWAIGGVWIVLFALLGVAHGRVRRRHTPRGDAARVAIATLMTACALYPLYTLGLRSATLGAIGNAATLAVAAVAVARTWSLDRVAAIAPCAIIAWVAFATLTIIDDAGWL